MRQAIDPSVMIAHVESTATATIARAVPVTTVAVGPVATMMRNSVSV